ncbi:hypothetical protein KSP40_PGU009844 [Platanthera guangdongensis]|uniref:Uncharacterized protein n=1 Tax=Platanthera guangdongensis TaxID=2320717 RepID=A0ABR2LKG2_9ASPA
MSSRVAMTGMSAQETLLRHLDTVSTTALALMTVSNPSPTRERLSGLSFSALLFVVEATVETKNSVSSGVHPWGMGDRTPTSLLQAK